VSHRLLAQCEQQRTATTLGHRSLEVLLRQMLRISAADARARIRAARQIRHHHHHHPNDGDRDDRGDQPP